MQPIFEIPEDLYAAYSMNGRVTILYNYCDNTQAVPLHYSAEIIAATLARVASGEVGHYRGIDRWLYAILDRHPLDGQSVAVIGSADQGFGPWYECVCLHCGGRPTTIEYNPVHFDDNRFASLTPAEYTQTPVRFDAAIAISSFEHDGLGRYGDPIDPDGDLKALQAMKRMLQPGGLLYLSVPLGRDKVIFNEHRIYGQVRLPKLLAGWTLIDAEGYDDALLDRDTGCGWEPRKSFRDGTYQSDELLHPDYPEYAPILVLRND